MLEGRQNQQVVHLQRDKFAVDRVVLPAVNDEYNGVAVDGHSLSRHVGGKSAVSRHARHNSPKGFMDIKVVVDFLQVVDFCSHKESNFVFVYFVLTWILQIPFANLQIIFEF